MGAAAALAGAGLALTVFSGFQQASAMEAQGRRQQEIAAQQAEQTRLVAERNALITQQNAEARAKELKRKAGQEQAASQRKMIEARRQGNLRLSRARAVAGASGAGVADPTALDIYGGIAQETDFQAGTALFEGESAANLLRTQAAVTIYEGERKSEMLLYEGAQQADLATYQGQMANFSAQSQASAKRMSTIGNAAMQAGTFAMKYGGGGTEAAPKDIKTGSEFY